jgi:hypothetical protein
VYFRAYNSCSSGFGTSSFSNILSADCVDLPPDNPYQPFTVQIKNHAGVSIRYKSLEGGVTSIPINLSSSFAFSTQTTGFQITLGANPQFLDLVYHSGYYSYDYVANVSSSAAVDCNVNTIVTPLLDGSIYSPTIINCGYIDGGTDAYYNADASSITYDIQVDIDRGTYTPGGTIIFDIFPNY